MLINHQRKFVFIQVPRTASQAAGQALLTLPGTTKSVRRHEYIIPSQLRNYWSFACVRNPYSRFVSHYRYRCGMGHLHAVYKEWETIQEYAEWIINRPMNEYRMTDIIPHGCMAYKYELLPNSWHGACLTHIRECPELQRVNSQGPYDWRSYLDQELADTIWKEYEPDFHRFNYHKDSWKCE